ncbi:MAG: hypothetical protein NZM35_04900 [Chitinophagales bacterium]|nr:hypothetical protein [Chitinophagales bacterium]MDW8419210.1 hypothetical protein [Chitinophagales bacterium]
MFKPLWKYSKSLFNAVYPRICAGCGTALRGSEDFICIGCETELPYTYYWQNPDNRLMMRFAGRVQLQMACSLLHFKKQSIVQGLIHHIKYKRRTDIALSLGKMLGRYIHASISDLPDLIVPVPLHAHRLKQRGYNQCDYIAQGLSEALRVPFRTDVLVRPLENISQTKKRKFERWENVSGIFAVRDPLPLKNKHVLLVDDVVTTGATAESCILALQQTEGVRVSFVALATAVI